MPKRLALAVALLPFLAGCGALFAWPQGPSAGRHLVVKVLVDLPPDLRPAAQLAIDQVNREHPSEFEQTTLQAVYPDDTYQGRVDGGTAKLHLRQYLEDPTVLGMVGPLNLQLAHLLLPIANNEDLVTVSPTLADECLTQVESYCTRGEPSSLRPHNARSGLQAPGANPSPGSGPDLTFFRVPPLATAQATAAADYASGSLGKSNAVLVVDNTAVAGRLADEFSGRWQLSGGNVAARIAIDTSAAVDARTVGAEIGAAKPDLVYLACTDPAAVSAILARLKPPAVTVMVPDQLHTDAVAQEATGWPGAQLVVSSLSADPARRSQEFLRTWMQARRAAPPPYALETWLATKALIEAIRSASAQLVAQQVTAIPTRQEVTAAMATVTIPTDDLIGLSFTDKGDDASQLVTMYAADQGRWTVADQVQAA